MYAEFAGDPVVQSLDFGDQRHFVILLCLKCNGTLDRAMDPKVRDRIICRGIGLDPVTASEAKRRLKEVGLIDDKWQPTGWNARQFVSDISTPRVRKCRKNKETGNVTSSFQKQDCNAPDTDTDTDTDKGTNVPLSTDSADALPDRHDVACPHLDIIGIYHDVLPELPRIVSSRWDGSADANALRQRWRESPRHQSLDFWHRFFSAVRDNPHWMGGNDRNWQANLRWLVKRCNFDKVIERMVTRRYQESANG
jgi:hypothetical protein